MLAFRGYRLIAVVATAGILAVGTTALLSGKDSPAHGDEVVATIGSHVIYMRDLERHWESKDPVSFRRKRQELRDLHNKMLDEVIGGYLVNQEAARQGLTVDQLFQKRFGPFPRAVTEPEIAAMYERSSAGEQGVKLSDARQGIIELLQRLQTAELRHQYEEELKATASAEIALALTDTREPVKVNATDATMGPASASVTFVEYSDFQCPYCQKASPLFKQLAAKYPKDVRLVWKNYPLPIHPQARPSAEAALCAKDQGQFWQYHDMLFANQEDLSSSDLKRHAVTLGLDAAAFNRCFELGKYREQVAADIQDGKSHGVSVTPTVFINGRVIMGALPVEAYDKIIREELAASKR